MITSKLSLTLAALSLCGLAAVGCNSNAGTDAGTDAATTGDAGSLYTRLGGHSGISGAVDAVVAAELMDPEIASYFYFQVTAGTSGAPPVDGHPSVAQIKSCFVNLLGNAAGGPEAYPGTPADNMGFQCRDMMTAHAGLNIPGSTFDRFVTIAAGVLTSAGVSSADVTTVGGVLTGTRAAIAQGTTRDGGTFMPPDASH